MEITDPTGGEWTIVRQVAPWRRVTRVSWAWEVFGPGLLSDSLVFVGLPILVLTLVLLVVALAELALLLVALPVALLLRALKVTGWRVIVTNTAKPVGIEEKTGTVLMRTARFSTTVLRTGTMAGSLRLQTAIAEHLRQGGGMTDPVVDEWLPAEGGKVISHEVKPGRSDLPSSP